MSEPTTLDELFSVARQHIRHEAEAKARLPKPTKDKQAEVIEPAALFANAANWIEGRGIALIHEETQTLLGVFREYTHRTEAGARKLLRSEAPLLVEATELCSGEWWIAERHLDFIAAERKVMAPKIAILDIQLDKLGVYSPACEVRVFEAEGHMNRVELCIDTQFAQTADAPEQLLWLAAGTNILPTMSRECKITLRVELDK